MIRVTIDKPNSVGLGERRIAYRLAEELGRNGFGSIAVLSNGYLISRYIGIGVGIASVEVLPDAAPLIPPPAYHWLGAAAESA